MKLKSSVKIHAHSENYIGSVVTKLCVIWKENPKVGDFLKSLYRQADVYYSKSGYDIFIESFLCYIYIHIYLKASVSSPQPLPIPSSHEDLIKQSFIFFFFS